MLSNFEADKSEGNKMLKIIKKPLNKRLKHIVDFTFNFNYRTLEMQVENVEGSQQQYVDDDDRNPASDCEG